MGGKRSDYRRNCDQIAHFGWTAAAKCAAVRSHLALPLNFKYNLLISLSNATHFQLIRQIQSLSLSLDNLCEPVNSLVDSLPIDGVRFLDVPGAVCDLSQVHLLRYFLLRVSVRQVRLVCKK